MDAERGTSGGPDTGCQRERYLAEALDITTGTMTHCVWYRKTTGLFLDLLDTLDRTNPATIFTHLTVVADGAKIHHAGQVEKWIAAHPRFELLHPPTYCSRANPIERAFGGVHDKCTRNHTRKRMCQRSRTSRSICCVMARGAMPSRNSILRQRWWRQSKPYGQRTSHLTLSHNLLRECNPVSS